MPEQDSADPRLARSDVSASEVANYVFCAKAWHLEQVLGRAASADAEQRRALGAADHAAHGASIRAGSARIHARLERVLVAVLLVALLLLAHGLAGLLR
jgi:hypothetical protein